MERKVQNISAMHLINHEYRPSVCHRVRVTNCETSRRHPTSPDIPATHFVTDR